MRRICAQYRLNGFIFEDLMNEANLERLKNFKKFYKIYNIENIRNLQFQQFKDIGKKKLNLKIIANLKF
jgi:hypothetical protein